MKSLLYILETAAWTIVALLVLIFLFGFLIVVVFNYRFTHTDLPWGMVWPLIWTGIGVVVLGMVILAWWWGRLLRDTEEANRQMAEYDAEHAAHGASGCASSDGLHFM